MLHVLCIDQDPLVPMSGTKPENTTHPFHFSLPFDFDKTSNKFFLLLRILVSGLFYLLSHPCPSQNLLSRPHPSQDLLSFSSKDPLPKWWKSCSWPKSGSFFFSFFFFFFSFFFLFCAFGPSWSFLTSRVGPSFVKAYGLSLLFMEWTSLSHFGPQQILMIW